jgi:hypothetical protein
VQVEDRQNAGDNKRATVRDIEADPVKQAPLKQHKSPHTTNNNRPKVITKGGIKGHPVGVG